MTAPAPAGRSARDTILARVREALAAPAPLPHLAHHAPAPAAGGLPILPTGASRPWLPDGGDTPAETMNILVENLGKLRAVVHRLPDMTAAADLVFALARERDWRRIAHHRHPLVAPLLAGVPCATYCVDDHGHCVDDHGRCVDDHGHCVDDHVGPSRDDSAAAKDALEGCDAGITGCEALVAQTGSILVSSATCGGRGLSVLPHVHVVIATADQVVATLGDALDDARRRHAGRLPSMLSFITGPSRTGDIERILVLGAHGPRELIVIIVDAARA
jgi:L-lactate dehydrogenase complex protein LldG